MIEEDIIEVKICEDNEYKSDKSKDIIDCVYILMSVKLYKDNKEDNIEFIEGELNEID